MGTKINNFKSKAKAWVNLDSFDPKSLFDNQYEEYIESKSYETNEFKMDFGKYGEKEYKNTLYKIIDKEDNSKFKRYVVAEEIISKKDISLLYNHCQCEKCQLSNWNPVKYFICSCCVGCIKSEFPSENVINKTRDYILYNPKYKNPIKIK